MTLILKLSSISEHFSPIQYNFKGIMFVVFVGSLVVSRPSIDSQFFEARCQVVFSSLKVSEGLQPKATMNYRAHEMSFIFILLVEE